MSRVIQIKNWLFNFHKMTAEMPNGLVIHLCEFESGRLGYQIHTYDIPKPFGTMDPDFDDIVIQSWNDHIFERELLLMEKK